jgi:hypothetical protein
MKNALSLTLTAYLRQEIETGNPTRALLWANEYFSSTPHIVRALYTYAESRDKLNDISSSQLAALKAGKTVRDQIVEIKNSANYEIPSQQKKYRRPSKNFLKKHFSDHCCSGSGTH